MKCADFELFFFSSHSFNVYFTLKIDIHRCGNVEVNRLDKIYSKSKTPVCFRKHSLADFSCFEKNLFKLMPTYHFLMNVR